MFELTVPKWGVTMEEAEIVRWYKSVGESVETGEPIAEIETDKATGDVESPITGTIREQVSKVGDIVEPGQVIAVIEEA